MTIRDLIEQVSYIQGNIEIQQMQNDEMTTLYEDIDGLTYNNKTEPYLDKEIRYLYADNNVLVIEVKED